MNGWMDGWMDGWTDGRTGGWADRQTGGRIKLSSLTINKRWDCSIQIIFMTKPNRNKFNVEVTRDLLIACTKTDFRAVSQRSHDEIDER